MGLTNYPNGLASFGVPVLPPVGPSFTTGNVFFVCNDTNKNGSNGNSGKSPDQPFATVDYAIGRCTGNNGDIIYVMPGHEEIVTATSIAHDVEGVSVIGLGTGYDKPLFTFSTAAATITISAANAVWQNCRFVANFLDVAAAFTIGAAKYAKIDGNTFIEGTSLNFLSCVVTGATANAADHLEVTNNEWYGLAATCNAFVSILGATNRLIVAGNDVNLRATNDAGHFVTIAALVILGARIVGNTLTVLGATNAAVGIFLTGSSTTNNGIVAYNLVASLDTTTELIATAGTKLSFFENYYTGTADASAKLWPVVDAA